MVLPIFWYSHNQKINSVFNTFSTDGHKSYHLKFWILINPLLPSVLNIGRQAKILI